MSKLIINIGSAPNSKNGDSLRDAFNKVNQNFTELYANLTTYLPTPTGNAGKFLTTNGTTLSWSTLPTPSPSAAPIAASATAPGSHPDGTLWYDEISGRLYVYYDSSWVDASPRGGDGTYVALSATGQTITDTSGATNYTLKIANGTTGSVFGIGTGNESFGVANDSLNHDASGYVPYNATASTMSFNIPSHTGSLSIDANGVVTIPNGLIIPSGTKASNAAGRPGQISYDANYIYICTATNTWKRSPLTGGY
jgi:hypothetical protein